VNIGNAAIEVRYGLTVMRIDRLADDIEHRLAVISV
jgi:hypothetical protein